MSSSCFYSEKTGSDTLSTLQWATVCWASRFIRCVTQSLNRLYVQCSTSAKKLASITIIPNWRCSSYLCSYSFLWATSFYQFFHSVCSILPFFGLLHQFHPFFWPVPCMTLLFGVCFAFLPQFFLCFFFFMGFWVTNTTFRGGTTFSFDIPQLHNHTLHKGIATMPFQKVAIATLFYTFFIIMNYNLSSEFDLEEILFQWLVHSASEYKWFGPMMNTRIQDMV